MGGLSHRWPMFGPTPNALRYGGGENVTLANILWTVLVVLVVLWLIGLIANITGGGLIHILLVIAAIILIYNLVAGRSTV